MQIKKTLTTKLCFFLRVKIEQHVLDRDCEKKEHRPIKLLSTVNELLILATEIGRQHFVSNFCF